MKMKCQTSRITAKKIRSEIKELKSYGCLVPFEVDGPARSVRAKINEFCCCPGLHAGLKLKTLRLSSRSTITLENSLDLVLLSESIRIKI